jgi:hypothetical protein
VKKSDSLYKWASSKELCRKSGDLLYLEASEAICLTQRLSHRFMSCIQKCHENKTSTRTLVDVSIIILLGISLQPDLTVGCLKLYVNWLLEPAPKNMSRICGQFQFLFRKNWLLLSLFCEVRKVNFRSTPVCSVSIFLVAAYLFVVLKILASWIPNSSFYAVI